MRSITKKILPILILGFLIEFSTSSITLFKEKNPLFDFHSVIAAEKPGDKKETPRESSTSLDLKISKGQDYIEQKWQLLTGMLRWDIYEILVGLLIFIGCLGFIVIRRFFDNEKELAMLAHELETARQIQSFILPQKQVDIKGVHLAAHYVPMASVAGDRFFLYTDGITEATNAAGKRFGQDRFKDFIKSHAGLPVGQFADELIQRVFRWSGKPSEKTLDDDLTLVVADFENTSPFP